jgi:hypothetical protein
MTTQTTTPTATTEKTKLSPVENHKKAAMHHESAAKHHNEAAKHHEDGNEEKAMKSNIVAQGHHAMADEHQKELNKHHATETK